MNWSVIISILSLVLGSGGILMFLAQAWVDRGRFKMQDGQNLRKELFDRIKELENDIDEKERVHREELKQLRDEHREEIRALKAEHAAEILALRREIDVWKQRYFDKIEGLRDQVEKKVQRAKEEIKQNA